MKLKKHTLIILSLFLMLFVCIGSVSALESQTDNIRENNEISISESPEILTASASDDAVGMSSDENIISSNNRDWYVNASAADGGDGSNISPYNNFKSVLDNTNLQDGDSVYFAGKENYKGNGINVNLDINKQLNLLKYGSGEAVFDAEHNSRIFTVYVSCINITGLTFINGNAGYGGAIYFSNAISNSNINATYINNTAKNTGGANYFNSEVSNSNINGTYKNNTAELSGANHFRISVSNSNITGTYNNNTANLNGGANSFGSVSNSNINGTYKHNTAKNIGGANYFSWTVSNSNITGTYNHNTAKNGNGGANHFNRDVSNSNINGTYNNNTANQNGGANYFWSSVSNSNITGTYNNNTASNAIIHFENFYNQGLDAYITNAIFLNNKCTYEIYARTLGVVVKDSWFGNNASNYMNEPNNYNVQMDSWLFLNGTNNQNDIKFFLMRYDGTTTSEYDNTLLPKINLTLTTTDGTLDKSVVSPDETVKFNPTESGINRVTAQIEDAAQTIEFTNGDFDVLQTIVNNATSSVINLTRNYTYNQWDTMTEGVLIDRNVTINGNGFTIDAKGKSRIFKVTAGSINITDVTFKNGKADNGGAIYFSNAIFNSNINATYINNTANQWGGANYFDSVSNSNITGTYNHNTAKNGGANSFDSVSNSNINGTYNHNTANHNGGANHFYDDVSNSNINGTYNHNTANLSGGANYFLRSVSNSNITGTYINNTASNAIIHFENYDDHGLDAYITNAIFLNNKCEYEIYARTLGVVVKDSWFGNNASNYMNEPNNYNVQMDSWLFLNGTNNQNDIKFFLMRYDGTTTSEYDNTLLPKINLTLTTTDGTLDKSIVSPDETVKFNPTESGIKRVTAQIEDAAQTIEFTMGDFNILQAVINNATSPVINLTRNYTYNQWDTMTEGVLIDKNVTINGNGYTIDAKGKSRIFKVTAGSINITDVTLKNGKADNGGAIYFSNAISNSNINATYINNTANWDGGANYFSETVSNSNINGTYNHNTANGQDFYDGGGGANNFNEYVSNSNITGTYNNNTANQWGGANSFYSVSNSNITGTYNNNTANGQVFYGGYGGANSFYSVSNSNINGTYNHNTANQNGGANYFSETVSNSNITGTYNNNTAKNDGGANHFDSVSNSNITGTYKHNTANNNGGANNFYFVSNSNITGTYNNNTANNGDGGANHFYWSVSNSNITGTYNNNTAKNDGGANYFYWSVSNSNITGTYINNTASNSIIHFENYYNQGLDAYITNAIFLNNKCEYEIYARTLGVVVKDSWFGNNASNYMNEPNNYNVQMDSWLFLNGTNNQNDIKFFLMRYDGTTTSEYDNTLLPKINLTLTTTDGTLDKSVVSPDETVKFNPTESGIKRVTAQIEDAAQTIEFTMGDFNILQGIINNATSSVINLTRNYTYNQWDTMTEGVLIDRNVTINGNGFTIDAKGKSRIFKVTAESINITDITLKNGKADNGGAIYFSNAISNSNINATYINNTANQRGGANNFNGDVSNSNITGTYNNNTANQNGGANRFNKIVSNSNITGTYNHNTAEYYGGANYFNGVSNSNITGTYNHNTAKDYGGANCFYRVSNSNITGTYNHNTADYGGANHFHWTVSNSNITGTYINNTGLRSIIHFQDFSKVGLDAYITNAIFLNNNCTYEIYARTPGVVVKDSWFGNNASNYMNKPNINDNVTIDNWLFLNATANPSSLLVMDSSNITFKLYSTDGENVSDFDNSKLPAVNLTLTATNGDVDNTTTLNQAVKYMATEHGKGSVTAKIENATHTICFDNLLRNVDLSVSAENIAYPENETLTLTYNNTATGKVNITLKSKNYNKTIESDINQTITIADLPAGEYNVTVEYSGDNVFSNATAYANFTVEKITTEIIPDKESIDLFADDEYKITYTLKPDYAIGNISFTSNDSNIASVDPVSGDIIAKSGGSASITITFSGSENYTASHATITVNVKKLNATMNLSTDEITEGENATITVTLPDDATGNATATVNGKNYSSKVNDGKANIIIPGLEYGNYTIPVTYSGDDKYNPLTKDVNLTVKEDKVIISAPDLVKYYSGKEKFAVNVTYANGRPAANKEVKITVNGMTYKRTTDEKGSTSLDINLNTGTYDAIVEVDNITAESMVTVLSTINASDIESKTKNLVFTATFIDGEGNYLSDGTNVSFNIKGVIYDSHITGDKGTANINLTLDNGRYIITSYNPVSGEYASNSIAVNLKDVNMTLYSDEITVGENATITATLPDDATGNVTATVNGQTYTSKVNNGKANIIIPDLKYGNYTIPVTYSGDDKYNGAKGDANVTVNKAKATIRIDAPAITEGENATVTVTLPEDANGKVTIGNEIIPVKDGTATAVLTGLKAGTNTVPVTYSGDDKYNPIETSADIIVNEKPVPEKENLTIKATADEITEGENATVIITGLENATGNISLSVNGKTYTAPINNGKSIITVPDLTENVTAVISYPGDDKYNSAVTTVNITVNRNTVTITAENLTKYYKDSEKFTVKVTDAKGQAASNKTVEITINGVTYKRTTDENGTAGLNINLDAGEYPVSIAVDDTVINSTVTVKSTIDATDVVKMFRNDTQYCAAFTDTNGTALANTKVSFNINGIIYNRTTDANGTAKVNINMNAGDYIITAINPVTGEMKSNTIKVISLIESDDLTKYYRNASQFVVRIHSADGGYVGAGEEVKFNVNGVFYTRTTNATGHAKLNINLCQGNYTITTYHKDCSQGNQITVLPILSADDLVMKYKDGSQFKAKLVDGQGKPYAGQSVQFNINGVLYNRITGSDGTAKLNINLMAGEYIITSSYNGFNIANKITIKG